MSIVCLFLIWNMWKLQGSSCAHADLEGQNREIFHPSTLREPLIGESCGKASPLTERVGEGFAPMKTYRCTCHLSFNPASKGCLRFDYLKETTTLNLETNSKQCWEHLVSTVTMVFIDIYIYIIQVHISCIYIYTYYTNTGGDSLITHFVPHQGQSISKFTTLDAINMPSASTLKPSGNSETHPGLFQGAKVALLGTLEKDENGINQAG